MRASAVRIIVRDIGDGIYHRAVQIAGVPVAYADCRTESVSVTTLPMDVPVRLLCPRCFFDPPREKVSA